MSETSIVKKATKAEMVYRIKYVGDQISKGFATCTILKDASKKFGVSERMVQNYIDSALQQWESDAGMKSRLARQAHRRSQLEHLYEKALLSGDLKTAILVMDRLCKIDGAFQPETHAHAHAHKMIELPADPEQREQLKQKLLKQKQEFIEIHEAVVAGEA